MKAFCIISDSGTLPEESSFYTFIGHPILAVYIRDSTERPEALADVEDNTVLQSIEIAIDMTKTATAQSPYPITQT